LGPCSGCPSCPLLRSPSGRGFFVFSLTVGAGFVASRVAWISGSEPPPTVTTPVTRVWQVKIPCLATEKPCGGFALHFYTAAKGFGPFYSVTMVGDLSVTRCGFQRSRYVGFWGHGASPCAPGGQASTGSRGLPLDCLYYSTDRAICQAFFLFSLDFFLPRPAVPLPEARGCVLSAWLTFISRTTGLRAAGVLGGGLTASRGAARSLGLPPPRPL
jgi:hypothetical protein